jgi:hypothetical protein
VALACRVTRAPPTAIAPAKKNGCTESAMVGTDGSLITVSGIEQP